MIKIIKKTSEDEIENIRNSKLIKISDEVAIKKAKIAFFVIAFTSPFKFLLNNIIFISIFFSVYSVIVIFY